MIDRRSIRSWWKQALAGLVIMGTPASAWPQTVSIVQDLSFGTFAAGTGGAVTISPLGVRTASGDVVIFSGSGFSDGAPATVDVATAGGSSFSLSLPMNASLGRSGGGAMRFRQVAGQYGCSA